jgi:hypothetical protein
MMWFLQGGHRVRYCGLLMDPEGKANFGHPFEADSLWTDSIQPRGFSGECRD